MSKAEQMKNLKNGNGIQYLLNEAYRIIGNPLNLFDVDYKRIAHTDVRLDDPFWNELVTTGTFCIESQMFFMNEYFTDDVANAKDLAIMQSDKLKYDRILAHVFNGNGIKVANLLMIESDEAFEPDVLAAFEILADLLTKEIRDDEFYIAYAETYQNAWIKRLIDYDIEEKRLYSPHVQILYDGLKAYLYLAVVDVSRSEARQNGHQYFVDAFRRERKDCKYAVYDNHIVVILSTDYKTLNVKRELRGFTEYFEQYNLLVGISSHFDNLFELHKYYAEAVQALHDGKPTDDRHIFAYGK